MRSVAGSITLGLLILAGQVFHRDNAIFLEFANGGRRGGTR